MRDEFAIRLSPSAGSWDRLAAYLFDEIKRARAAKNHVMLGIGAAQLVVLLLGLYAMSKIILAYIQSGDGQRYYGPDAPEFAAIAMIIVVGVAAIWLLIALQRLRYAFQEAISLELEGKAAAFWSRLETAQSGDSPIPAEISDLLKKMGLHSQSRRKTHEYHN